MAAPPSSCTMMCAVSSTTSSVPRSPRIASAIWLPIVAVGRETASSCPSSSAPRRSSSSTVGSSRSCSSPTSAFAIASRMAGDGFVTVSERRSTTSANLTAMIRCVQPHDPYTLPAGLPVPEDDGAADHLPGTRVPSLVLESSQGPVDLADLSAELGVLYVYPRTGRPGVEPLPGWDDFPGARGCTPQSCAFRDHAQELADL